MPRIQKSLLIVSGILLLLILSSCFIPENFTTKVQVRKNGDFIFIYNGNLAFAPALSAIKEGSISKKDEKSLKDWVTELKKDPDFKAVRYIGDGRYKVTVEHTGKAGEKYHFISKDMKIFSIESQPDRTLKISAFELTEKDLSQLQAIDAKVSGNLNVSVEKGVQIVKHNADIQPKTFNPYGDYQWVIKKPGQAPLIILKP
ncbi:MAG: hypothetical protein PHN44_09555 [Candidatus Marinimicrobia bacterium]|nr:hypothetical protein [Candidatus Neomarinimicrobiota bacterium]